MKKQNSKRNQRNRKRKRLRLERLEHRIPLAADVSFNVLNDTLVSSGLWVESEVDSFDSAFYDLGFAGIQPTYAHEEIAQAAFPFDDFAFDDFDDEAIGDDDTAIQNGIAFNEVDLVGYETFYEADYFEWRGLSEGGVVEQAFFDLSFIDVEFADIGFEDVGFDAILSEEPYFTVDNDPNFDSGGFLSEGVEINASEIVLSEEFIEGHIVPFTAVENHETVPLSVDSTFAESEAISTQDTPLSSVVAEIFVANVTLATAESSVTTESSVTADAFVTAEPFFTVETSVALDPKSLEVSDATANESLNRLFIQSDSQTPSADAQVFRPGIDALDASATPRLSPANRYESGIPQVETGPLHVSNSVAISIGDHHAVPMTEGMRSLGLNMLLERHANVIDGYEFPWNHQSAHAIETGSNVQAYEQATKQWSELAIQTRLELSIAGNGYTRHDTLNSELFVGSPVERLHGFEAFDIFRDLVVDPPPQDSALPLHSQNGIPFSFDQMNWITVTAVGLSIFGTIYYTYNRKSFHRRLPCKTNPAALIWGHATDRFVNEVLDETRPIIVKLSM